MVRRLSVTTALAAGAALLLGAAGAQAACNLKRADVPVTMDGLRPLVKVKVNGQDGQFLLDSGAFYNSISAKLAQQLKLRPAPTQTTGSLLTGGASALRTSGAAGRDTIAAVVNAPTFAFAGQTYKDVSFVTLSNFGNADGILGQNFLHQVDVEYDLGHRMIRLVQPEGCAGANMAYWTPVGMSYSVMPIENPAHTVNPHTIGTVTINGVKLRAYFDTGAATSFITERAADRAGVKTSDPGVKAIGVSQGIERTDIKTWLATFSSIKIGDEEIKNSQLAIGQTDALDFDILIGADFFLSHHVYVANSQGKLYFTYSGGPVFHVRPPGKVAASEEAGK